MIMKNENIIKFILTTFLFMAYLYGQFPSELNHPSTVIAKRLAANGILKLEVFTKNHLSKIHLNKALKDIDDEIIHRHIWGISLPEFDIVPNKNEKEKNFKYFRNILLENNPIEKKNYIYKAHSDSIYFWIDISERITAQLNNGKIRNVSNDMFSFNAIIDDKIYLSSIFSIFRHSGKDIIIKDDYHNEWTKYFPIIQKTFWYKNYTSFFYKNSLFDLEIANYPFSWGWSSGNSNLISSNSIPFNRVSIYKRIGNLHLEYFHGALTNDLINKIHSDNIKEEKYIAGHKLNYNLKNMIFSLSEIVIYGNRSPELGYINPISFFWAQEHNLGDLDNILLAFDFGYRFSKGFIFYNSIVIDELSWEHVFSDWWGNKFSNQTGLYISSTNLKYPDLRFELTITRPWTYTHPDFSFSNRQISLGSHDGPSSISYKIESFIFPYRDVRAHFCIKNTLKGIGLGTNILDNYDYRDKTIDNNTKLLMGSHYKTINFKSIINYYLSNKITLEGTVNILHTENKTDTKEQIIEMNFGISLNL